MAGSGKVALLLVASRSTEKDNKSLYNKRNSFFSIYSCDIPFKQTFPSFQFSVFHIHGCNCNCVWTIHPRTPCPPSLQKVSSSSTAPAPEPKGAVGAGPNTPVSPCSGTLRRGVVSRTRTRVLEAPAPVPLAVGDSGNEVEKVKSDEWTPASSGDDSCCCCC